MLSSASQMRSIRFSSIQTILFLLTLAGVCPPLATQAQGGYNGAYKPLLTGLSASTIGGVNVDIAGNVFVADSGGNRVVELPANGGAQITLGSGLSGPGQAAVDSEGNLYIADTGNNRIGELPWTGSGYGDQITLPAVGLNTPGDVQVDGAGDVFIADCKNNRVVELPAGGGAQITVPVTGMKWPAGLGLDAAGDLFIADQPNS